MTMSFELTDEARRRISSGLFVSWLVSLFLPVATSKVASSTSTIKGVDILLNGWLGWFDLQFGWYANPIFLGVLYGLKRLDESQSGISLLAMGSVLILPTLNAMFWSDVLRDEGGGRATIIAYHVGYFCWLITMLGAAALAVMVGLARLKSRRDSGMI